MMKKAKSERKKRSVTCKRITRPGVFGMIVQEGGPVLSSLSWGASMPHVLLNGAFAEVDAQLEQFAPDPFCSPQAIIPCHLLNQGHSLSGDLGCGRYGSGLVFPVELEALAMPPQERLWLNDEESLFPGPHHSCQ